MKKCYVHLQRLPEHIIKSSYVKIDMECQNSSQETIKFNEIEIKEHENLNDNFYRDNVIFIFILMFKVTSLQFKKITVIIKSIHEK